ncbi:MAG: L-2-hydroxyglutarate oxidase [Acidimicrobiales bacterium]
MARPSFDVVVVGAGLVGLATAYRLLEGHPSLSVAVVDKEASVARHQSSHNSGVLHSGVYYAPGSLKARLCISGKASVERFAAEHGVRVRRLGKLIVAVDRSELGRLDALRERAESNGVPELSMIGPDELAELEPHVSGIRALRVPGTSVVDFSEIARAYAQEVDSRGGQMVMSREVQGVIELTDRALVLCDGDDLSASVVITCAGLQGDRFGERAAEGDAGVRLVPFRGDYYRLTPDAAHLVRGLVYPVPDPSLPFLGVHLTRRVDDEVWIGPNAVLALAREGYRRRDLDLRDVLQIVALPGFRRLARRWWRTGVAEVWRDLSKRAFLDEARRFLPDLRADQLAFGPSGVRAQALSPDGRLVDDFVILGGPRTVHVRNAPSPAATASLAIGSLVAERALRLLEVPQP